MNKYMFIGSVDYSAHCLQVLLEMNIDLTAIMCPRKEFASQNNDYRDLTEVAGAFNREAHYFNNINEEEDFIKSQSPDVILVFGLSQIIAKEILGIPKIGVLGSHPTMLPKNRGRHPIVWTLVNGLKKSGVTLFWLNESVDSGDIWAQEEFNIQNDDDAASVYEKVKMISEKLLVKHIPELEDGKVTKIPQNDAQATYGRKRNKEDGEIKWGLDGKSIYDLVRGLAKPYVGAHGRYNGKEFKVWKVRLINGKGSLQQCDPGMVLSIDDRKLIVKTGDGAVEIIDHDCDPLPSIGVRL